MPTDGTDGRRSISRRSFVAATGAGGLTGLAGCINAGGPGDQSGNGAEAGSTTGSQSGTSGGSGDVQLTAMMFTGQATEEHKQGFRDSVAQFEEQSDYSVEIQGIAQAGQIIQQTQTRVQGGSPPDVVLMPAGGVLSMASQDLLAPVGDRLDSAETFDRSDIVRERKFDIATFEDQLYGVPAMSGHWGVLYYNPDMLEQIGRDPMNPDLKTWPKFLQAAREVKEEVGIRPVGFSGADHIHTTVQWHGFFSTTGQDSWLTEDKSDTILDESPGLETAKLTQTAAEENLLPNGVTSMNAIDLRNLFTSGELFAYQTGGWEAAILADSDTNYGITWNPQHPDGRASGFSGGWFFVFPKGSPNQEEAWELVEHLMKVENITEWAQLPPILSNGLQQRFSSFEDGLGRDVGNIFIDEIKNSSFPTIHPNQGKMWSQQRQAVQSIMLGEKTAEEAMNDLDSNITDLL